MQEEGHANARLIAAAPDMAEALRLLLNRRNGAGLRPRSVGAHDPYWADVRSALRKAGIID
jgi:hypothetical protein